MTRPAIIALITALLTICPLGQATAAQVSKQITVEWLYPPEQEADIVGFRLYNQAGAIVFDKVSPALRSLTAPYTYDDAIPQAFHMVSVGADGQISTPSNIFVVQPPFRPLTGVGTITIKIQE